jgi:Mrp family chromosome partitioning ATPase
MSLRKCLFRENSLEKMSPERQMGKRKDCVCTELALLLQKLAWKIKKRLGETLPMEQIVLKQHELPYEVAEQLKTLRTNIRFCGDDKRVILITSCLSGEGKSTMSLELTRSLAELDKRVLLIDCDLTEEDGVYLMPAGAIPPNPSELLSSDRMARLIAMSRKSYDYVIADCAPLGMVVDAAVIAPFCDGVVLVIEAGNIPYGLAQEVAQKLKNTHCPILGAVLNKVDRESKKYYKYGKYYNKRYEEYYQGDH